MPSTKFFLLCLQRFDSHSLLSYNSRKKAFGITATDPDDDPLIYSASNVPINATFNPATQTFSWTPGFNQGGTTYDVIFSVSDGELTDSETITITVNEVPHVNEPPVLDSIGNRTVNEGATLSFIVTASDPDLDALSFLATNLPAGAAFNPGTQRFSWNPGYEQAGTYEVTFSISDGEFSDSETVTINVNDVNCAPMLDPIGEKTIDEGTTLSFPVTASDLDGDALSFSATNLPSGATFDPADPFTQSFNWTPGYDQAGTYDVIFSVSDGELSDSETITITVNDVIKEEEGAGCSCGTISPGSESLKAGQMIGFLLPFLMVFLTIVVLRRGKDNSFQIVDSEI